MLRDATEEKQLEDIRRLYESSFPKSEKKPFEFMRKRQKEGAFHMLAIEDEAGEFRGLAIMMLSGGWALLDYLAIEPDCQGTGLGSRTLEELQRRYGKERLVVEIESTAEDGAAAIRAASGHFAGNWGERLRRKAFYLRNGMVPMDFMVNLFGVEMEVLTFGGRITFEQYHGIYAGVLPREMAEKVKKVPAPGRTGAGK